MSLSDFKKKPVCAFPDLIIWLKTYCLFFFLSSYKISKIVFGFFLVRNRKEKEDEKTAICVKAPPTGAMTPHVERYHHILNTK